MKKVSMTQGDLIALIVGAVLTIISVIVFFVFLERTPVSPTPPPTVTTSPAALPSNPPVMALALPSGSSNGNGGGGMGSPLGMMGRSVGFGGPPAGMPMGARTGGPMGGGGAPSGKSKFLHPQMGKIGG